MGCVDGHSEALLAPFAFFLLEKFLPSHARAEDDIPVDEQRLRVV